MFLKIFISRSLYIVCFAEPMNISEWNGVHVEKAAHCEGFVNRSLRYNYILRFEHAPFSFRYAFIKLTSKRHNHSLQRILRSM